MIEGALLSWWQEAWSWLDLPFMVRAMGATTVLCLGLAPVGAFLVLRRLSLAGEAIAHAVVPGIAIAFVIAGLGVWSMLVGGLIAGLFVALASSLLARVSLVREDASLAALYLIALALGIFVLSVGGSAVPLERFLFGDVIGMRQENVLLIGWVTTITVVTLALVLRPLVVQSLDPTFFESQVKQPQLIQLIFMLLVVLNLIAAFRTLGTLMAVGLMILPAVAARFWASSMTSYLILSVVFAILSCWSGLLTSYFIDTPSGPSIVLAAGVIFLVSLLLGPNGLSPFARKKN